MVRSFARLTEPADAAQAGGKGRTLAGLHQAGHPVPDGFVVLSSAFDTHGLRAAARELVSASAAELLESSPTRRLAVRSSATSEDSAHASFAGAFDTVLDVASVPAVIDAVAHVFDSARRSRPHAYAAAVDAAPVPAMAVIVQHMLAPSCAGVLFTVDPVSGDRRTMPGNAVEETAGALLAGEDGGDAFSFDADSGVYHGPAYLAPHHRALFDAASRLATEAGAPRDVEWAVAGGRVWILQSRPITNLARTPETWNDAQAGECLWCNTNLGELFGQVVTPFTWSVFRAVVGHSVRPIGGHFLVGRVGGRIYFNISYIASILSKLGKTRGDILRTFDLFMGNIPDHVPMPPIAVSWPAAVGFVARQVVNAMKSGRRLETWLAWARNECPAWCEARTLEIADARSNANLLRAFGDIEPVVFETFAMVAVVGDRFVQHEYKLKAALEGRLDAEDIEVLKSGLDDGRSLESMGPLLGMSALVAGRMTREEFVRRYGHRGPNEAEFAAPRTAETPGWIDDLLAQWHDADPESLLERQRERRRAIWASLDRDPATAQALRALCATAATLAQNRELAKSENFRQAWVVRRFVQRAAEVNGLPADTLFFLEKDELLQFLRGETQVLDRIGPRRETLAAYASLPALPNLIVGPFDPFLWARMPNRRTDHFVAHPATLLPAGDTVLHGCPACAGTVEGVVRVLRTPDQMHTLVTGEVLVTSFTNVGWTPVFPRASAIVTDIGAPLSHAAIVARELGVPAVVGTGTATMRLRTGDRVRVDGTRGTVERL